MKNCVYCGESATEKDHVIPLSYYYNGERKGRHLTAEYGKENLVDSCKECNVMAGGKVFDDIEKKKEYIQERITLKYKKVINMPFWSDDEIKEMSGRMRKEIKIQQLARKWIYNRINYPIEMSSITKLNKEIINFLNKEL